MRGPDAGVNRRNFFLRGLTRAIERAGQALGEQLAPERFMRPPGALPEAAFVAACTRCGACTAACPVAAISPLGLDAGLASGTPALEVNAIACAMCPDMPCTRACPTGALVVPDDRWESVHIASVAIDRDRCITWRDVECGVCARACPVGPAALAIDAQGHPVLHDGCTGCGTCIAACVTAPSSILARPYSGGTA